MRLTVIRIHGQTHVQLGEAVGVLDDDGGFVVSAEIKTATGSYSPISLPARSGSLVGA
jgi:hypothetical protein